MPRATNDYDGAARDILNCRVIEKVDEAITVCDDSGCHLWAGGLDVHGYGRLQFRGKTYKAHRLVYTMMAGPINPDLTLDHLCRNRACVNPDHLEPVTNRENILRGESFAARNFRKTQCPKCGSDFSTYEDGRRYCLPCDQQYHAERWKRRRILEVLRD